MTNPWAAARQARTLARLLAFASSRPGMDASAAMSTIAAGATADGEWDEAAGVWRGNRAVHAGVEVPDPLVIFGYGE